MKLEIERYTPRWHSDVIQLANTVFGQGYFDRPWEIATKPGSYVLVAQQEDRELLGFAQGELLPRGALGDHLGIQLAEAADAIAEADANGALGAIEAVAVAPAYRRRGIGKTLLEALHDGLVGLGADKLIITFRRGPGAAPVDGLMAALGFEPWMQHPSYWRERCESGAFRCIDRRDRCTCEAVFYRKKVF